MSDSTPISNLKNNSEENLSQEMPTQQQLPPPPPSQQSAPLGPPQNTSTAGMQYYQQMAPFQRFGDILIRLSIIEPQKLLLLVDVWNLL